MKEKEVKETQAEKIETNEDKISEKSLTFSVYADIHKININEQL